MLSQAIKTLRHYFAEHRHGGITLSSEDAEYMTLLLKDCEFKAQNLEQSKISPSMKLTQAHLEAGNVIQFPIVRRQPGRHHGGGAA